MSLNRTLFCLALAVAASFALVGESSAFTVCRTADGSTYASDNPPPDCMPISRGEVDQYMEASRQEELATQPIPPSNPVDEAPESDRTHAIASCEQSVAEQLERPSSASWPNRSEYKLVDQHGRYRIEGYVEAEQALGASRVKWTCEATYNAGRWIAVSELSRDDGPPVPVSAPYSPSPSGPIAEAPPPPPPEPELVPIAEAPPPEPPPAPIEEAPPPAPPMPAIAEAPVAASATIQEVQRPAIASAPPSEPAPPPAEIAPPSAPVVASSSGRWKEQSSCRGVKFEAGTEKDAAEGYQVVSGQITYTGMFPIRDVRVCASGACTQVTGAGMTMRQGASEKFSVRTPSMDTPVLTAQCSILVD